MRLGLGEEGLAKSTLCGDRMKLTKKKALEIAIELWEWIVDNPGRWKNKWPGWAKYGWMSDDCPFCEYEERHPGKHRCNCPLKEKYGSCYLSAFLNWHTEDEDGGHAAAVEFLAQLKELK